jgi:nitrous oxidase accessory protein NosD
VTAPACTYRETVTINKPLTLRGYGSTISGKDAAGTTVRPAWVVVNASDVTVEGFTMRDANNAAQTGAVKVKAGVSRFTLRACDLAYAAGANLSYGAANDSVVEDCAIHHAGQLGVAMGGDGTNGRDNVLRNSRIYANNTAGFDVEWEAGGLKATRQTRLRLEGNEVYDNAGPGFWCDIYCRDIVVAGNRIHHNSKTGIEFEVSTGATIRGNWIWENGWGKASWGWGAGIGVYSSGGAEVYDNIVAWNYSGISVISQDRQDWSHSATNNYVHDNTIIGEYDPQSDRWLTFWAQDWAGIIFNASSNNRGSGNRYWMNHAEDSRARFAWGGPRSSLAAFNATPGEEGGTYLTDAQKTSILTNAGMPTTP